MFLTVHKIYTKLQGETKFVQKVNVHWTEFLLLSFFGYTEPDALPWFTVKANAGKSLVLLWGMSCLVLNTAFNSNLRAVLLRPVTEKPIDSVEDGMERGTNMWVAHFQPNPDDPSIIDQWFLNHQ